MILVNDEYLKNRDCFHSTKKKFENFFSPIRIISYILEHLFKDPQIRKREFSRSRFQGHAGHDLWMFYNNGFKDHSPFELRTFELQVLRNIQEYTIAVF